MECFSRIVDQTHQLGQLVTRYTWLQCPQAPLTISSGLDGKPICSGVSRLRSQRRQAQHQLGQRGVWEIHEKGAWASWLRPEIWSLWKRRGANGGEGSISLDWRPWRRSRGKTTELSSVEAPASKGEVLVIISTFLLKKLEGNFLQLSSVGSRWVFPTTFYVSPDNCMVVGCKNYPYERGGSALSPLVKKSRWSPLLKFWYTFVNQSCPGTLTAETSRVKINTSTLVRIFATKENM